MNYYKELEKAVKLAAVHPYVGEGLNLLEEGKTYWTYFFETSKSREQLRNYTGVFEVIPVSSSPRSYSNSKYWSFEIKSDTSKWGRIIAGNIHTYMNGYGCAYCAFYDKKELAIQAHDLAIMYSAEGLPLDYRKNFLKRILDKNNKFEITDLETRSLAWYEGLSESEKEMCDWIKYNA